MYRHQDGMSGFSYIFVLTLDDAKYFYLLSSITTLLYCRSLHWAGPLICVQRSGQSGQLSPAPALAPAPSVEGGGGQTGPVRGGGSDRHRALWGEEWAWHTGLGAWHLSTLTLRLRLLGGLDTGQGWTPPTITRAPHTGARDAGAHYESLGVSQSWRRECWSVGGLSQVMSLVSCEHSGDILMSNGHPSISSFYRGENIQNKVLLLKCRGIICWKD